MSGRKMFCNILVFSAILALALLAAMPAFAEKDGAYSAPEERAALAQEEENNREIQAGASSDIYSKYIWRGQTLVDDPVFQPSAYIGIENFTGSVWGNYSFEGDEWTELDYTLDYTTGLDFISPKLERVGLSLGYIYYDFPNLPAGDDSQELYAAVAVDTLLCPSLSIYWDFDQGDGTYYELGLGHSVPLGKLALDLSVAVGYNDGQWDFDPSFSAALFGASLAVPISERIVFEPGIFYSAALDNQYDDEFYGGFSLSFLIWD